MPMSDRNALGEALGLIVSGAFVVTARYDEQSTGFLASWVQQAAFEPPLISLAVKVGRPIQDLLNAGAPFVVNILAKGQDALFKHFARGFSLDEPAFEGVRTIYGITGSPILADALAYLECRPHSRLPAGDHVLYIGEVVAGEVAGSGAPQVRVRKSGFEY